MIRKSLMVCHCVEEANVLSSITTSLHWSPTSSQSLVAALVPSIHHRHVRQVPRRLQSLQRCGEIQSKSCGVGKNQQGKNKLTKISFTYNSIELAVKEIDMCTVHYAWDGYKLIVSLCV